MIPPVKRPPVSEKDIDTLARTIYGEARGEARLGRVAVAWAVRNRASWAWRFKAKTGRRHPLFGDGSLDAACRARAQFSCWNALDPNLDACLLATDRDPVFRECLEVARDVVENRAPDPTSGAKHYHAVGISPVWAAGQTPSARIGAHLFYNGVA